MSRLFSDATKIAKIVFPNSVVDLAATELSENSCFETRQNSEECCPIVLLQLDHAVFVKVGIA